MHFTKMHGLGNDYLYYYGELEQPKEMSIKLSDRHFGIGSDGIITINHFRYEGKCRDGRYGESRSLQSGYAFAGREYSDLYTGFHGNPHAVIFVKDAENAPLTSVGATLEKHEFFPDGVNVEFVEQIERNVLRMRVWERGSGITMACGTGACAAVAAAVAAGICPLEEEVSVLLDGGKLQILVNTDRTVIMTGTADTVCECEV